MIANSSAPSTSPPHPEAVSVTNNEPTVHEGPSSRRDVCDTGGSATTTANLEGNRMGHSSAMSGAQAYLQSNNNKKVLLALCVGMASPIGDWELEPYASAPRKSEFKPDAKALKDEIKRRAQQQSESTRIPRPSNWTLSTCIDWLVNNPIEDEVDVEFICGRERIFRAAIASLAHQEPSVIALQSGWYTKNSFLRLYHVLVEDELRLAFLGRNNLSGREGTDARNNHDRPATFYELAALRYNNVEFQPMSIALPSLHIDFASSVVLVKDLEHDVSADDIKKKIADVKGKMLKVVTRWERSGNGSGQRVESDENFGQTPFMRTQVDRNEEGGRADGGNRTGDDAGGGNNSGVGLISDRYEFIDGDDRQNFLRGEPSHILYLWHLMEHFDLLNPLKEILPTVIAADSQSVPKTTDRIKRGHVEANMSTGDGDETSSLTREVLRKIDLFTSRNSWSQQLLQVQDTLQKARGDKMNAMRMWIEAHRRCNALANGDIEKESETMYCTMLKQNLDELTSQVSKLEAQMYSIECKLDRQTAAQPTPPHSVGTNNTNVTPISQMTAFTDAIAPAEAMEPMGNEEE